MPGFLLRVVRVPESRGAWRRPRCEGRFWEAPVGSGQHAGAVDGGARPFLRSANVGIRHSCCPPQAIFDDLMFDAPSWGDDRIHNDEVGLGLFDDAQDTFFGDARSLFAPKIVTPPPSPPEARAKLVHTVSWDGFPVRAPPAVPAVEDDDLSAETPPQPSPQRKRRKSSSSKSKKAQRLRGQPCPSELRWAAERTEDMPEKRPVGISLASGSSSGWRLRIAGTQLGHYPSAAEAWAAYPKATADAVAGLS